MGLTSDRGGRPESVPEPAEGRGPNAGAEPTRPSLGERPDPIERGDPLSIAGRKAMWVHAERMLAREASLGDPDRPDEARKYRVAIRRLRAAIRLFGDGFPDREIKPLRKGLSELARTVGAVRDVDLRIADLNRWSIERGEASRAAVSPMLEAWGADRDRAVATLLDRVGTRRHHRLVQRLVAFVESRARRAPRARFDGAHTVGDRLGSTLWAAYEEVRAYAAVVRWADVETLHGLRIATKRLRDGIELLGDLAGPAHPPLLERLVALQDHLGTMNDASVAADAVRAYLDARQARLDDASRAEIDAYLADLEREVARLRRSSVRPWRTVADRGFARRLSQVVVAAAGSPTVATRSPSRADRLARTTSTRTARPSS